MKLRLKKNYFLIISSTLFLYFFFNMLDGDRGLISLFEKKRILNDLTINEQNLKNNIQNLEFKNSLLTNNIDLDFIETLIREKFVFGQKNDKVFIIERTND